MSKRRKRAAKQAAVAHPGSTNWRGAWLPTALLLVVTVCAYWPALFTDFYSDDAFLLTNNPHMHDVAGLLQLWRLPTLAVLQYYPVAYTSFWMEYQVWGLWPVGYHLVNILLHAGNALLLWRVLHRLAVPGAWLAAAIFALHPVHVESVAWISERKNVLSLWLALWALLVYLRFAEQGHRKDYVAALLLYVAALLSKTVVCSLPAVILLLHWWKSGRLTWRDTCPLWPLFALGLSLGLLTAWLETADDVWVAGWELSGVERLLVASRALFFYVGKLLWPHPLLGIYPRWAIDTSVWWQWLFPLAALLLTTCLYLWRRRLGRGPLVAWLIFAGVLVPALGFFNLHWMRFSFVSDHYQYHASVALIAVASALLWRTSSAVWTASPQRLALSLLLLLTLGRLSWSEARDFRNSDARWAKQLTHNAAGASAYYREESAKAPGVALPRARLALTLTLEGQLGEAEYWAHEAVRLVPDWIGATGTLAYVRWERGEFAKVEFAGEEARRRYEELRAIRVRERLLPQEFVHQS